MSDFETAVAITEQDATKVSSSLTDLYQRHSAWLRAAVRLRGGAELTDDVVQESFLRISAYALGTSVSHPRALLLKIAENLLRSSARAEARASSKLQASIDYRGRESAVPADQFEAVVLKQTILSLPEIYRDVFMLSRFGGMSYQEIAEARGLAVKTVEWRMTRALAMCAARMRE